MRTRFMSGLSLTLLAAGLITGAIGLYPTIHNGIAIRGGILIAVAAAFPWHTAQTRTAAAATAQQLADAKRDGYLLAIDHIARRGLFDPPPTTDPGCTDTDHTQPHRNLHSITYTEPERRAE